MKRSLQVIDGTAEAALPPPRLLRLGGLVVSVSDTGDGVESELFAGALRSAVGDSAELDEAAAPILRIVIRGAPGSSEARVRAAGLEASADLVIGSFRPVLARILASACASWASS